MGSDYSTSNLDGNDRDRTLRAQQQPKPMRTTIVSGSILTRQQITTGTDGSRQEDSANYSLTSSNESAENARPSERMNRITGSTEFATSIV